MQEGIENKREKIIGSRLLGDCCSTSLNNPENSIESLSIPSYWEWIIGRLLKMLIWQLTIHVLTPFIFAKTHHSHLMIL
uniref:Uncharacterized protein n=1 Tax=Arundo donax TaxID=35708 RepID=A0A0A9FNC6_ARUDO